MTRMTKTMMQTFSGKVVDLAHFTEDDVRMVDIAHALSIITRFTGHTTEPYSVAQHSIMVSRIIEPRYALWGLLHDASEAYLGDVSRPLKSMLSDYRGLERHVQQTIAKRYGLAWPMPEEVHRADNIALVTEKRDILPANHDWGPAYEGIEPVKATILPRAWDEVERMFKDRFKELWT